MKFKSQICTTREQSKRLLALGLKKETADMVYHYQKSRIETIQWELRPHPPTLKHTTHLNVDKLNVFKHKKPDGSIMTGEEYFEELWGQDIPAWSLHRLINLLPVEVTHNGYKFLLRKDVLSKIDDIDNVYDEVLGVIQRSIELESFNKDYLEERK